MKISPKIQIWSSQSFRISLGPSITLRDDLPLPESKSDMADGKRLENCYDIITATNGQIKMKFDRLVTLHHTGH